MVKKKLLRTAIALSTAAILAIPAVTVSGFKPIVVAADAGVLNSSLLNSLISKFSSANLSDSEKAAIGLSAAAYLNSNSDGVLANFFSGFTSSEEKAIKDKFGFSSESLNAVIKFIKTLSLQDLSVLLNKTAADSTTDDLNARLVAALKSAGVTDAQLNETIRYVSSVNNMSALTEPVLVDDSNNKIKLGSDSAISALVDKLNALSSGVKLANSTNVKSVLNAVITEYNNANDTVKSGLIKLLKTNNVYGTVSTGGGTIGGGTAVATPTPTPTATPANVDDALKTVVDIKDAAKVEAAQKVVDAAINSAAKVTPTVDTTNAKEAVMTVSKENAQKAIEAVLAIQAKVASSTAKDVIKVETKVTIEAPAVVTQAVVTASLPTEIVDLLKTYKIDELEVKVAGGTVVIPVELLSAGKDVKLSVNKVTAEDTKKAVDNAKELTGGNSTALAAFDYTLNVGGEKQTVFSKPINLTVNVDANAVKPNLVAVYYIDTNGKAKYVGGKYSNGSITFTVKHFSEYVVLNYTKEFSDVTGNWIASTNYLQQGVKRLIAKGDAKGNFNPNNSITRAEFAAFIARTLQLDLQDYQGTFNDITVDDWFAQEVEAVKAAGIVDGVGDGEFAPNKNITREEMAKMIANAYSKVTGKTLKDIIGSNKSNFSDFDKVSTWAKDYVSALENLKVVEGSNGTYKPLDNSTRAESLKVIVELADKSGLQ